MLAVPQLILLTLQDLLLQVGVIIACCATVVVHFYSTEYSRCESSLLAVLQLMLCALQYWVTQSGSYHCLLFHNWCPLHRTDNCKWESSLLVLPQSMKSSLQYWVLQVGVIITCCATVDVVRSVVLSTTGGDHYCLLYHSCWSPLYRTEYHRVGAIIAGSTAADLVHYKEPKPNVSVGLITSK